MVASSTPRLRTERAFYSSNARPWALALVLAGLTLLVFLPALKNGFVWDDEANLLQNPGYRGLGGAQLRWMLTSIHLGHWIPMTWASFGLDYLLWGLDPAGYHLTNLLVHAANAGIFFLVTLRLLGLAGVGTGESTRRLGAAAAALFFALHPLRAESVAWTTERKDVLAGLFFLLTILAYLRANTGADDRRRLLARAASVAAYALAVISKISVAPLPLVLVVLDVYPLRRLGVGWRQWVAPEARTVWVEKVPYLALTAVGSTVALYAVQPIFTPLDQLSVLGRVALYFNSAWFYLSQTLMPVGLSPLHELPEGADPLGAVAVGSVLGLAATAVIVTLRRRWPAGLALWTVYLVMLLPVGGLLHNGYHAVAERYSYLTCLGWAVLLGAAVSVLVRPWGPLRPSLSRTAAVMVFVWILGLAGITWHQVQIWRDARTLWTYALDADPQCSVCRANLGVALFNAGQPSAAVFHLTRALSLRPSLVGLHGYVGVAWLKAGDPINAEPHLRRALELHPREMTVRAALVATLIAQGRGAEAEQQVEEARALDPAGAGSLSKRLALFVRPSSSEPPGPRGPLATGTPQAGGVRLDPVSMAPAGRAAGTPR